MEVLTTTANVRTPAPDQIESKLSPALLPSTTGLTLSSSPDRIDPITEGFLAALTPISAFPDRTEMEKAERRRKVSALLRKFINRLHLQWFSEDDMLQWRFERVFELFQHPKWNKQLTYILLDNLLLELFPDVFSRNDLIL
ncbi:unnamed protein product [Schistocephalus solidus]|uniref:PXA domain-containing protein n=1 Tax=Schistocephalus solidus TaxID=70667 RepID=A0A183THQ4_SCHSO|nr:unnamed protein product [Schistocephalus solidus]